MAKDHRYAGNMVVNDWRKSSYMQPYKSVYAK